ncbi:ABC transporter ATP-binding protein [Elioraea sp.]|jgi:branched-chain amino acid transport system ATP-binding protein|uniref:ABC transporter ATP-binding protein n=1 Tax=Elioraea sp. TaxID=2185103 RepID=UPI0021DCA8B6|nr:ABC transporter ATP-binding protein [Elioraea sp.]GIX11092.1 MAG: ABC transporter ATP-binding protein [Elioraea sp.]
MLELAGVTAAYGPGQVLFGIDLRLGAGEVVALAGRNGMGKTTTIRAILGLVARGGRIVFDGRDVSTDPPHRIARRGIGLVPEGRQVFPTLSVRENLVATARGRGWDERRVFALFPRLEERAAQPARTLSGGEQQMLAIGRALMTNPRLLILDEATEGLAPLVRAEIWAVLARLKAEGLSILVVDKDVRALARLADRFVVLQKGGVAWQGTGAALLSDEALLHGMLGV